MEMIGEFAARLYYQLRPLAELALRNWPVTMAVLIGLIYWAGHERRSHR